MNSDKSSAPTMTPRQRFINNLTFSNVDRIYYAYGKPRKSTMEAWYSQGLPRMTEVGDYSAPPELWGFLELDPTPWGNKLNMEIGIFPAFEEKTIREDEHSRLWRDENGIIMLDAGKHLATPGFRTRSYHSHPVSNMEEWERMKERFDPSTPGRYPEGWSDYAASLKDRDTPILLDLEGLFWKVRDWVGFEVMCVMFYDQPELIHEMMEHNTVFLMDVLDRALTEAQVDGIRINEDMAYKHAAMISPQMIREFMIPRYHRIVEFLKTKNIPVLMVDSDGYIGELLPVWEEVGFNATYPIEIAAANDPLEYREKHPGIAFMGGIDKRQIRSKQETYDEIMSKVPQLVERGGYLPAVDHAVPPDIPLRSYIYMGELIKAIAEGREVPGPDTPIELEEKLLPPEESL